MSTRFDAVTDLLTRASTPPTGTSSGFTWMGWVYLTTDRNALGSIFALYNHTSTPTAWIVSYLASDGTNLRYDMSGATGAIENLSVTTWYHLAITYQGTTVKAYINGALDTTASASTSVAGALLAMGSNGSAWYNGRMAAVKIWNRVLSDAEVTAEYPYYDVIAPTGIWAQYPMEQAGSRTNDASGNGNHLTENGTLTSEADPPGVSWFVGTQTINANLISSTATVRQPALTTGAVAIAPHLIASAATVYQPAVSQSSAPQNIALNLVASSSVVRQPAVTVGSVTVSANAIASTAIVRQPAVTTGTVSIAANLVASTATVYQPAVSVGSVTISVNAIASVVQVYQPEVSQGLVIAPNLIASTATVRQPTIAVGAVTVSPSLVSSVAQVLAPTVVPGSVTISTNAIAGAATVYQPAVSVGTAAIHPTLIASVEQVYSPALTTGSVTVSVNEIASAVILYLPVVLLLSSIASEKRTHTVRAYGRNDEVVTRSRTEIVGGYARTDRVIASQRTAYAKGSRVVEV